MLWAWVPLGGRPMTWDMPTLELKLAPPIKRCTGAFIGALALGTAQAKLQNRPAAAALGDARRLGGDQRLVVEHVEQRGLDDLGHGQRALNHRQRRVGVDDAAFGNGADGQPGEVAVTAKPVQKVVGEDLLADAVALAAQILDILVADSGLLHPGQEGLQAGVDAIAGLVAAVVGIAAEEVVKLDIHLVQAGPEIELGHGELVLIREEDAFGNGTASVMHVSPQELEYGSAIDRICWYAL